MFLGERDWKRWSRSRKRRDDISLGGREKGQRLGKDNI